MAFNTPVNPHQIYQSHPQNPSNPPICTTTGHDPIRDPIHHHHHHHHLQQQQPKDTIPDYEQRLRDEVIYLHSLWRRGPLQQNPNPHLKPTHSTHFKKNKKKTKPKNNNKTHIDSGKEWPVEPKPASPSPSTGSGWPEFKPRPSTTTTRLATAEEQARALALRVHLKGLDSCVGLFHGDHDDGGDDGSDDDIDVDDDDDDDDYADDCDEEFESLWKVFEGDDNELRSYCQQNWESGDFYCLVCGVVGGGGGKKRKQQQLGRKYKNCVALVQHSVSVSKTKMKKAHRAYGYVMCKVLGWDINRLPSVPSSTNGDAPAHAQPLEKPTELELKPY